MRCSDLRFYRCLHFHSQAACLMRASVYVSIRGLRHRSRSRLPGRNYKIWRLVCESMHAEVIVRDGAEGACVTDHRVPDLCDHPWSSAPGLLLLSRSSSLHAMSHLPPADHETSKHVSPNETEIKVKLLKCLGFKFKSRQVNDSSQSNQVTDYLVSQHVR
jgi:hypothetical protein